jgi:hypothetical protein
MAGWGIGLASFGDGFAKGIGLGNKLALEGQAMKLNDIKIRDAERAEQDDIAANQRKTELRGMGAQADTDFQNAVAAGDADANHPDDWFSKNYAPRVEAFYLKNNDLENANKWHNWSKDTETKAQIKTMGTLIGKYHDAAISGDFDDFSGSFGKFYNGLPADVRGNTKFKQFDVTKAADGTITGITATFDGPKGKAVTHTWNDLGSFQQSLGAWVNPSVLYDQTMKSVAEAKKFKTDLAEYAAKKGIDARAAVAQKGAERAAGLSGKTPQERYQAAQDILTKASTTGKPPTDAEVRAFLKQQDDYAAEQAPGIAPNVAAAAIPTPVATAAPAAPAAAAPAAPARPAAPGKVIIDTKTGKPVQPAAAKPIEVPAEPASVTAPRPGSTAPATANGPMPTIDAPPADVPLGVPQSAAPPTVPAQAPGIAPVQPAKGQPLYTAGNPNGLVQPGNIDLTRRPVVQNPDGSISTVRSITIGVDGGRSVVIPTVINGRVVSDDEAIAHFKQTGEHLGIFGDEGSANRYAEALHEQQAQAYAPKRPAPGLGRKVQMPQAGTKAAPEYKDSGERLGAADVGAAISRAGEGLPTPRSQPERPPLAPRAQPPNTPATSWAACRRSKL